jgi:hypothetical protein
MHRSQEVELWTKGKHLNLRRKSRGRLLTSRDNCKGQSSLKVTLHKQPRLQIKASNALSNMGSSGVLDNPNLGITVLGDFASPELFR